MYTFDLKIASHFCFEYRQTLFYCFPLDHAFHVLRVSQMEGLWWPHSEQACCHHFSNSISSLCVSESCFGNSHEFSQLLCDGDRWSAISGVSLTTESWGSANLTHIRRDTVICGSDNKTGGILCTLVDKGLGKSTPNFEGSSPVGKMPSDSIGHNGETIYERKRPLILQTSL